VKDAIPKVKRGKVGQALRVVVVTVREQQRACDRLAVLSSLSHQLVAQADDPRPGINDDQVGSGLNLKTGRVPAEF
jgi:hypothetical protein